MTDEIADRLFQKFDQAADQRIKSRKEAKARAKEGKRIANFPNPFKAGSYKGFKFLPVLDPKARIKYLKAHDKQRIIYYNPFFIDPLSPGQKIYLAESTIRLSKQKVKNVFTADEAAFYYVYKKYKVGQEEIGKMTTAMSFKSAAHKQDRIFNLATDSVKRVNRRKRKEKIIKFLKSLIPWPKKKT